MRGKGKEFREGRGRVRILRIQKRKYECNSRTVQILMSRDLLYLRIGGGGGL